MIVIEEVSKSYSNKKSLQNVSLTINKGQILGLIGPNGAGKSTLLKILATISAPNDGKISMNGFELPQQQKQVREMIGYVPQDVALWEHLTVKENMVLWSKLAKQKTSVDVLIELCKKVQLHEKWNEKVSTLSGGMKRKLNIAVALIHNPPIILMDEPTVGIDIQSKLEINHFIAELAKQGKTIIFSTHDMNEILYLCTCIAALKNGILHFTGTMAEARKQAVHSGLSPTSDEDLLYHLLNGFEHHLNS